MPRAYWLDWLWVRVEVWGSLMGEELALAAANNRSLWALDSILWMPGPEWETIPFRWWQRLLRRGHNLYDRTQVVCEYYVFSEGREEWVPFGMLA